MYQFSDIKMTLLTSSSRKCVYTFLINNVDQLKSREIIRFSPAVFHITRQARQLSTASALCGRFYNGSATSKQLLRSSGMNVSLTLVKKKLIFLALHILRFLKLLQFKKKIGMDCLICGTLTLRGYLVSNIT